MLKFIKHNMETIVGVEIFPLISFIIFFTFFVGLIIYVIKLSKASVEEMSALPLHDDFNNGSKKHQDE